MVEGSSFPDPGAFPPEQRVRSVEETSRNMDRRRQSTRDEAGRSSVAEMEGKSEQGTEDELESSSQWGDTEPREDERRRPYQEEDEDKPRLDIFA